jgi:hypothetical protein
MTTARSRRASLASVCCAALAALTLATAGATAAKAGATAPVSGSGGDPIVTTSDGAVRGVAGPGSTVDARGQHAHGLGELRGQRQPGVGGRALAGIRRRQPPVGAVARPATARARDRLLCQAPLLVLGHQVTAPQGREKIPCPAKLKSVPSRSTCLTK